MKINLTINVTESKDSNWYLGNNMRPSNLYSGAAIYGVSNRVKAWHKRDD